MFQVSDGKNEEFDYPLPKDKKILKLISQAEKQKLELNLIAKRRMYSSQFILKNFKKFSQRTLEQSFLQMKQDYMLKNILKDICTPEDIILLGALILKVKLHSKILTSKNSKLSIDVLSKNIEFGIPTYFLDNHNQNSKSRKPQYWAEKIEEQYFKKKEFLAYSIEDIQVKFLTALGRYNLMFSNYYVVTKGA